MIKIFSKKITILFLLFLILSMFICYYNAISAETSPFLDLENSPGILLNYNHIKDKSGIILNRQDIEPNLQSLGQYLNNTDGTIIIPNRDPGNILGWYLTDIQENNYTLIPFFLYNTDINKNSIDYIEELNSAQNTNFATDFMSSTISFSVYGTDWFQNQSKVATVYIRNTLNYFDIDNSNYNYYIGEYEVLVAPVSGTYVNEFYMALMNPSDYTNRMDSSIITTNSTPREEGIDISIGAQYTYPIDDPLAGDIELSGTFNYHYSAPDGASTVGVTSGNDLIENDSSFVYTTYAVNPSDNADAGDSYAGLIHVQYRAPSWQTSVSCGLTFYGLDLGGNIGKPGYNQENTNCAVILNIWDTPFDTRRVYVASGESSNIPTNDPDDQGFGDYDIYSSLPNQSVLGAGYWFYEN